MMRPMDAFIDTGDHRTTALAVLLTIAALAIHRFYVAWKMDRPIPHTPMVSVRGLPPKQAFQMFGEDVVAGGFRRYPKGFFQVATGTGPKMVLNSCYADEVARSPSFNLSKYVSPDLFADYAGFEGIRFTFKSQNERLLPDLIRRHVTSALAGFTQPLTEEAYTAIRENFGQDSCWRASEYKRSLVRVVAQMTSRVFWGHPLCHDQRWLNIVENYAIDAFYAGQSLRTKSSITRPLRSWFSPLCQRLRAEYSVAKTLVVEEMGRRRAGRAEGVSQKQDNQDRGTCGSFLQHIEAACGDVSAQTLVDAQLALAVAAIAPTAEMLCQALRHLCQHSQYIEPLRREAVATAKLGWTRMALYNMSLMDSFLKESMRFCRGYSAFGRMAMEDVTFSDGNVVQKGTRCIVAGRFWDADTYGQNVRDFDGYRFLEKRKHTGEGGSWQFAAVNPAYTGFGLGFHACPGRFLASNVIKIALGILLSEYDFCLNSADEVDAVEAELLTVVGPKSKLRYRKRHETAKCTENHEAQLSEET